MKIKVIYFNHTQQNCGVYQYGRALADKLARADCFHFFYAEVLSQREFVDFVEKHSDVDVIYINYHPATMPWINRDMIVSVDKPVIGILHEFDYITAFSEAADIFDFRALIDPSIVSRVPNVTSHPRVVIDYKPKTKARSVFTVGSFGFATPSKCFDHVVKLVQREYEEAVIRFNITQNYFYDPTGTIKEEKKIADYCRTMVAGSKISLEITHDLLSPQQLVDFLAENTINLFVYTAEKGRGVSSVIDYAVAAGRPFGVSDSQMFRHLQYVCPEVFISRFGIKGILENGDLPAKKLKEMWSDANLILSYQMAAKNAIDAFDAFRKRKRLFNIILDDIERTRYENDVAELKDKCPQMMERKIPEANVQQAFVKAAVEHFSGGKKNLNVLCIGSFEDTAYETLKTKGYNIVGIDPAINIDLDTFYNQRSTVKSSFDIIFSTSVIEHVKDDELFISQIRDLLAVDGVAILTMDFNDTYREGAAKPSVDCRLYTSIDILYRLIPRLHYCELVDYCFWQRSVPDFTFDGARYSFASLVFKRRKPDKKGSSFSSFLEQEILANRCSQIVGLTQKVNERDGRIAQLTTHIQQIETSRAWRFILAYRRLRIRLLQPGTLRRALVKRIFSFSWNFIHKMWWILAKPLGELVQRLRPKVALRTRLKSWLKRRIQDLNAYLRKHPRIYLFAKKILASHPKLYARMKSALIRYESAKIAGETNRYFAVNELSGKPEKVIILGDDYGLDQRAWLSCREKLFSACLKSYGRGLELDKKNMLWICFVANPEVDLKDWENLLKTIQRLEHASKQTIRFVVLGKIPNGKTNAFGSANLRFIEDMDGFSKMFGDNDIVFFSNVGDYIDEKLPLFLSLYNGFKKDFTIFDMYFVENNRAYPILLHGVDPVHARYCDYFFSRFCLKGRVFHKILPELEKHTIRDLAMACLDNNTNISCLHIPLPLMRINVDHGMITKMRDSVKNKKFAKGYAIKNISVVICTKDNAYLLQQLIWRLQREPAVKEIVIVSHNSKTPEMLMLLKRLNDGKFIRVLQYNKPFNFSEQSNFGVKHAIGENILFLNDDICPVSDDWLELLIESLGDGNQISGPLLLYPNQTVQHGGMYLGFRNIAGHIMRHSIMPDQSVNFALHAPRKVSCLTGAAMLVPRKIFEDLNGFDPLLPSYAQDVDFCLRATGTGIDLIFDPRSVLLHFESMTIRPLLNEEPIRQARGREIIYFKKRWGAPKDNWLNPNIDVSDESMRSIICPRVIQH